jgi:tripartite-type tricarboxylate transporter receptor subunit TctC
MLVAHPGVNVTSVKELTDLARAQPGRFSYGSCGNGTPQHFAGELYRSMANINIAHIPYRGCAPALTDVLGGQVKIAMINGSLAAPYIKTGKLQGLAVTSRQRLRTASEVPTFDESGYKDFEMSTWYGMTAPRGVPARIVDKIYADTVNAMKDSDLRARLQASGVEEWLGPGAEMVKLFAADIPKYAALVKQANIKVD